MFNHLQSPDYTPNPDGTFTFDLIVTWSFGTGSNTDSGTFGCGIDATASSLVIALTDTDKLAYDDAETLSGGSNAGTFTDKGTDSSDDSDTITLNGDGTGSETWSANDTSTDKYNLADTGVNSDGGDFTWGDGGTITTSYHDKGSGSSDGTGTDEHHEDDTNNEKATFGETGAGGIVIGATATSDSEYKDDFVPSATTPGATTETTAITDSGGATSDVGDTGSIDGGSFTVDDKRGDTFSNSDLKTVGSLTGTTDDQVMDGSDTDTLDLTLSGIDDTSGTGIASGSLGTGDGETIKTSNGGTHHDTWDIAPDSNGQVIDNVEAEATNRFKDDVSGSDPLGAFGSSEDGNGSSDITGYIGPDGWTQTGDVETHSTPDGTSYGTAPGGGGGITPLGAAAGSLMDLAYNDADGASSNAQIVLAAATEEPAQDPAKQPVSAPAGRPDPMGYPPKYGTDCSRSQHRGDADPVSRQGCRGQ